MGPYLPSLALFLALLFALLFEIQKLRARDFESG